MASAASTVGIICGGRSGEHEVSLRSARGIYGAVDRERYAPLLLAYDRLGFWRAGSLDEVIVDGHDPAKIRLNRGCPAVFPVPKDGRLELLDFADFEPVYEVEVLFPIIHGTDGEDGALQGWLRMMNVPFVGADVLGSAVGMDKDVMKRLLAQAGLPVARFHTIHRGDDFQAAFERAQAGLPVARFHTIHRGDDFQAAFERAQADLKLPVFVKPACLGSSVGVSKATDRRGFEAALEEAFKYDDKLVVEEAVPGREIECSVLGNRHSKAHPPRASKCGEIVPKHDFYSYAAKYLDDNGADLVIPAKLDPKTEARIQDLALKVFHALECDGLARVDFFLRSDGQVFVNELNSLPGFTPISMYPKLWEASGLSYKDLITQLIELAQERHRQRMSLKRDFNLR